MSAFQTPPPRGSTTQADRNFRTLMPAPTTRESTRRPAPVPRIHPYPPPPKRESPRALGSRLPYKEQAPAHAGIIQPVWAGGDSSATSPRPRGNYPIALNFPVNAPNPPTRESPTSRITHPGIPKTGPAGAGITRSSPKRTQSPATLPPNPGQPSPLECHNPRKLDTTRPRGNPPSKPARMERPIEHPRQAGIILEP